jgi:hypothetical protein
MWDCDGFIQASSDALSPFPSTHIVLPPQWLSIRVFRHGKRNPRSPPSLRLGNRLDVDSASSPPPLPFPQPHPLLSAGKRTHWRVPDMGLIIPRETQVHQAIVIFQYFRVSLNGSLPIIVNASFQFHVCALDFRRVGLGAVVMPGLIGYALYLGRVQLFAPCCEHAEVGEDVVLRVAAHP